MWRSSTSSATRVRLRVFIFALFIS
jgi:hypothetical protein